MVKFWGGNLNFGCRIRCSGGSDKRKAVSCSEDVNELESEVLMLISLL